LEFSYSLTDRIVRQSLGEHPDLSGAKYDGDFTLSLEQAQRRKHEYVVEQIGAAPGQRVLDLGCGWGGLLHYLRERGCAGVGVTLSSAQLAACKRYGLVAHMHDARDVTREQFGSFDAVASIGAFEHFCSPEDYRAGRQESIYRDFFARVSSILPEDGRLFVQTCVWGADAASSRPLDIDELMSLPPRDTDEWYLALLGRQFPGSWPPFGQDQVVACATPHFQLISTSNGRLDYIETINQWNARVHSRTWRKALLKLRLLPRWLTSADFRLAFTSGVSAHQVCFERGLLDHHRLVFQKRPSSAQVALSSA
jgi:cyclopropane-fatty-acyl-phospholipid synthase